MKRIIFLFFLITITLSLTETLTAQELRTQRTENEGRNLKHNRKQIQKRAHQRKFNASQNKGFRPNLRTRRSIDRSHNKGNRTQLFSSNNRFESRARFSRGRFNQTDGNFKNNNNFAQRRRRLNRKLRLEAFQNNQEHEKKFSKKLKFADLLKILRRKRAANQILNSTLAPDSEDPISLVLTPSLESSSSILSLQNLKTNDPNHTEVSFRFKNAFGTNSNSTDSNSTSENQTLSEEALATLRGNLESRISARLEEGLIRKIKARKVISST